MNIRTDIQPGGATWEEFLMSVHNLLVSILRETRRLAGIVPYKTIPYPSPTSLIPYILAMKTQYTMDGDVCKVRVGRCMGRFGVFATEDIVTGNVITVIPVDAIYITPYSGAFLTPHNESIDHTTIVLRNTRHDDIFIASSLLYFCPERCGHMIHHDQHKSNVTVHDIFGGVMNIVQLTHDVKMGEELLLPNHSQPSTVPQGTQDAV